jgi:hypothetical protein
MDSKRIHWLIELLPIKEYAPDPKNDENFCFCDPIRRLAKCLFEPSFGIRFARHFVQFSDSLPDGASDLSLKIAYDYMTLGYAIRPEDLQAFALDQDGYLRNLLRAYLICPGITTDEIAKKLGVSKKAVELYDQLFWNVRDRLNDQLYIAKLVFPETRLVHLKPHYLETASTGQLLLQIAYEYGHEEMERLAGMTRSRNDGKSTEAVAMELESQILKNGSLLAKLGGANQKNSPGMNHAKALLLARQKSKVEAQTSDDIAGLGAISVSQSIWQTVDRVTGADVARRLAMQNQGPSDEEQSTPSKN